MQDHGLIGVAILPLLIVAVIWRARGESKHIAMIFGFTVLLEGLFSHRVLSEEYMLLLFGVVAAMTLISRDSPARGMQALPVAAMGAPRAAVGR
jgi:dolichyl-phosphate-mannose--protein O-mannosyl transferase